MVTTISKLSLKPGIHQFPEGSFGSLSALIQDTNDRRHSTLIIACSELGSAPDNLSFAKPGQCVVLQHLAASIPSAVECKQHADLSFSEIEKLIEEHDFGHVAVCGHLECGVIRNWLNQATLAGQDFGNFRLRFELGTRRLVDRYYYPNSAAERCTIMICEHVLVQLQNLITHRFFADRLSTKQTVLHGWIIDDYSARVLGYRPEQSAFIPL